MFKIRGIDGKEYGPVTSEILKQWLAQGRVLADTPVQAEGSDEWKPLSSHAELTALLAPNITTPPPLGTRPPPLAPTLPPKTSGLAVTSLVLGVLGCLVVTALAGLVTGIMALVKIRKSRGRLAGQGLAITGICLSLVTFVCGLVMMAFMARTAGPAFQQVQMQAQQQAQGRVHGVGCVNNMKQIALGIRIYTADHNETLPPAATWADAIAPEIGANPNVFRCSADRSGQRSSFAYNAKLDGLKVDKVDPQTVMIFECKGGWNVSGDREILFSHHGSTYTVAYVDGSVHQVYAGRLNTLRWDP